MRSDAIPPVAAWALVGLALYAIVGVGSLFLTAILVDPILGAIGLQAQAGLVGLSVRNALHPVVWGLLVAAASIPIGRRLVPGIRFSSSGWVILVVGLGLSSVTWYLLEEFVRWRFEYMDPEYVGFSLFTWPALVAISLAGWAAFAVPRGRATSLFVLIVLAVIGFAIALLPSVAGAADGIEPGSMPLAVIFLCDVLYAIAVLVAVGRRAVSGVGS